MNDQKYVWIAMYFHLDYIVTQPKDKGLYLNFNSQFCKPTPPEIKMA